MIVATHLFMLYAAIKSFTVSISFVPMLRFAIDCYLTARPVLKFELSSATLATKQPDSNAV